MVLWLSEKWFAGIVDEVNPYQKSHSNNHLSTLRDMIKSCVCFQQFPSTRKTMMMEPVTMMISKKPSESPMFQQVGPKNHQWYVGAYNSTFSGGVKYPSVTHGFSVIYGGYPCHYIYNWWFFGPTLSSWSLLPTANGKSPHQTFRTSPSSHAYTPEI